MSIKWYMFALWFMIAGILFLAACTPGTYSFTLPGASGGGKGTEPKLPGGQSQPGAAGEEEPTETVQPGVASVNATYKFSVISPADFVIRVLSNEELVDLHPKPVVVFTYMNPETAQSEVPNEPSDLEIRVYDPAGATSLNGWLQSVGLTAGMQAPIPFKTAHASGVEVCRTTMIAPNCFYFFFGRDWVYQLTTMTQEGDIMVQSFVIVP